MACFADPDPCIIFEPKYLYRAAIADVPLNDYIIPLGKAEVIKQGTDVTVIGYGRDLSTIDVAVQMAEEEFGINGEIIDLR